MSPGTVERWREAGHAPPRRLHHRGASAVAYLSRADPGEAVERVARQPSRPLQAVDPPVQIHVFEEVATDAGTAGPADGPGRRRPVDGEDRAQAAGGEGFVPRPIRGGAGD